ncbi:ABC transporter permease [Fulvivirgaceae bacterium PWU4]|uniref:ABC transporter permease n=1 Tax=Chryseosolibacter histidini TaxID=2782349 RepID=A0AAP2DNT6_9BACT|nr:ABC transporter permease [Chryseosolibacter histidini]MBT1699753.1 ABC transporter permease [Chryseosolibacter histidini]
MLKNYLQIVLRSFVKNRTSSFINIAGLALGLSCFTVIALFVEREFSYDRFHHHPGEVYRIVKDFVNNDGSVVPDATTPPALARAIRETLPEVKAVTRIFPNWNRINLFQYKDKKFYELNVLRLDSNFFKVFDFPFVAGSSENPFNGVHSILLTETTARKYFGEEDPIGKVIRININNGTDYTVSGVLKDVPDNSHLTFDVLIPFQSGRNPDIDWNRYTFYTYARLHPGTDASNFEQNVKTLFKKHQPESNNRYYIQRLTDIHLKSNLRWEPSTNSDITYVNILIAIAVFVVLIAGINYVNLVTAHAAKRAKEVGVRKVTGARRSLLIRQFLFESMVMVLAALGLSVIITTLLLPVASGITGHDLAAFPAQSKYVTIILPATALLIGVCAGLYPAFYLSAFDPLKVLRGRFFGSQSGINLRRALVVFQFVVSTTLVIGVLIITAQLDFMRQKKLGFNQENILMLPNVRGGTGSPEAMVEDMRKIGGISNIARADGIFGSQNSTVGVSPKTAGNRITLNFMRIDYAFIPTLQMELKEGRNFSNQFPSDSTAIIINEKAARQFGLEEPFIGQRLLWDDENGTTRDVTIVGVVKDFHFTSFHEEIKPFGFILEVNNGATFFLKVQAQNFGKTLREIENIWAKHNPEKPFEYTFQDEYMSKLHATEARFQKLFSCFTVLAIIIACLGLFGLVTALAESRTKEIGIRKVLGATATGIIGLLSGEFVKLIVIALIVASPLAYIFASFWLEGFAYHTAIGWQVFAVAGLCTLVIALATVSLQAVKAALANPVDSLRSE